MQAAYRELLLGAGVKFSWSAQVAKFTACDFAITKRSHRVGQVVHIGQSVKASKTSKLTLKTRPAPSKAPIQKQATSKPKVQKENAMNPKKAAYAFNATGNFSWSKTFGPWALAIACTVQTGGSFHHAHPYAPS